MHHFAVKQEEPEHRGAVAPLVVVPAGRGPVVSIRREAHAVAFWSVAGPFLAPYPEEAWPRVLERQSTARAWWAQLAQATLAPVLGLSEPRCTVDLSGLCFPPRYAGRFGNSMARYLSHACRAYYTRFPQARTLLTERLDRAVRSGDPLADWRDPALAPAFQPRPLPGCRRPGVCPCADAADQSALRLALFKTLARPQAAAVQVVRALAALGGAADDDELGGGAVARVVYALSRPDAHYCFPWLDGPACHRRADGRLGLHPLLLGHVDPDPAAPRPEAPAPPELPPGAPEPRRASPPPAAAPTGGAPAAGTACFECRVARRGRAACLARGHRLEPGCANERLVVFAPCTGCATARRSLALCLSRGHAPVATACPEGQRGGRRCGSCPPAKRRRE